MDLKAIRNHVQEQPNDPEAFSSKTMRDVLDVVDGYAVEINSLRKLLKTVLKKINKYDEQLAAWRVHFKVVKGKRTKPPEFDTKVADKIDTILSKPGPPPPEPAETKNVTGYAY